MSEAVRRESPLVERIPPQSQPVAAADAGVTLREPPRYGYINLRGNPDEEGLFDAIETELGCRPPLEPNTVVSGDRVTAIWLGPDEWYLRTAPGAAAETANALERALARHHVAINDGSSGVATLVIEGPHARDVLEKGCTLDLHPRVFRQGRCGQTLLAQATVVLRATGAGDAFEIIVRRSLADYLFVWLTDAADEFGMAVSS